MQPAIVLLSGGLDSTTTLAIAQHAGFEIWAISFDYGQKNRWEVSCARRIAENANVKEHRIVTIDLRAFGGSSLTSSQSVERGRAFHDIGSNIPSTYVPARNTIFLTYALAWAEALEVQNIFIGVNALDSSGYPDCRPEFIRAYETMANFATRLGTEGKRITIQTPLLSLTKTQIVAKGLSLGVDYAQTSTCYDPEENGTACGTCDACRLRQRGFLEAGSLDPVNYRKRIDPQELTLNIASK